MKKTIISAVVMFLFSCSSSELERGLICLRLGDYTRAIQFFDSVLTKHPDHFEARVGMGKAYIQMAADNLQDSVSWKKAIMNLEAARAAASTQQLNTLLSQVWQQRGKLLLNSADTLSALEAITRAIEYDPASAQALNLAGIIYFRMGRIEKSRTILGRAIAIDSMNPAPFFNLGMIDWHEGNIADAHTRWMKALQCSPDDEDIIYWFARSEKELRDNAASLPEELTQ